MDVRHNAQEYQDECYQFNDFTLLFTIFVDDTRYHENYTPVVSNAYYPSRGGYCATFSKA